MMELSFFLELCIAFFTVVGYLRGIYREFVGLAGIVLTLFVLTEFGWVLNLIIGGSSPAQRFTVEALILILFTFFSYQQAPGTFAPRYYRNPRTGAPRLPDEVGWQTRLLGALFGGINGYLVVGSLWYMMDQLQYPLSSLFLQPALGSSSANFVNMLPLVWLQQGNLLVWLVAGLFLIIIVFR